MAGGASLYAILGLAPGADRAAIDAAYRRLIKLHHPDLGGGDPSKAAEINRAYAILKDPARRRRHERDDALAPARTPAAASPRRRSRQPRAAGRAGKRRAGLVVLLAAATGLLIARDPLSTWAQGLGDQWNAGSLFDANRSAPGRSLASPDGQDRLAVDLAEVARGRRAGAANFARGGVAAATDSSRLCYRGLKTHPRSALLDRCIAHDDAVAWLAGAQSVDLSGGHFQPSSLTARHIAAARLISNDFAWIEARLDRIRLEVERALASRRAAVSGRGAQADRVGGSLTTAVPG